MLIYKSKELKNKNMEIQEDGVENVTISDILRLATWDRQRSSEELNCFVDSLHSALPDNIDQ